MSTSNTVKFPPYFPDALILEVQIFIGCRFKQDKSTLLLFSYF